MTLCELQSADLADEVLDRQARATARREAVLGAPEAQGRELVAFSLLLRLDLSSEAAILFLRQAPHDLSTAAAVRTWVEAIPHQDAMETMQ